MHNSSLRSAWHRDPATNHSANSCTATDHPHLLALSDLHTHYEENRQIAGALRPQHPDDWLLVPGDCGEFIDDVLETLAGLAARFSRVIWVPGNHELWNHPRDPKQLRGTDRYDALVEACREIGVLTPEDPFPIWLEAGQATYVAPTFVLYDYSFHSPEISSKTAHEQAVAAHHVLVDDYLLDPHPYPTREQWCRERVAYTEGRMSALVPDRPITVVNHYPLHRLPTRRMYSPHLPLWCGTSLTEDWHRRFAIDTVVYGHLHMPFSEVIDGVRYEEVSLGYPREWGERPGVPAMRRVRCGGL